VIKGHILNPGIMRSPSCAAPHTNSCSPKPIIPKLYFIKTEMSTSNSIKIEQKIKMIRQNQNRGFRRLHRLKIITSILVYLEYYLREVFQERFKDCVVQVTQNFFYFSSVISVISVAKIGEEK